MTELDLEKLDDAIKDALRQIRLDFPDLESELQQANRKLKEAIYNLAEHAWTVPWNLDIRMLRTLADCNRDQIDSFFEEYYADDALQALREDILGDKQLENWKVLLDQCFENYERGNFHICIPSLIAVLEGSFNYRSFFSKNHRQSFFDNKVQAASTGTQKYTWISLRRFCEVIFKSGDSRKASEYLHRNRIMHGWDDPTGWLKIDCLRLFQALDSTRRIRQ